MASQAPDPVLTEQLRATAQKLQRFSQALSAEGDAAFEGLAPELHMSQRAIQASVEARSGQPTPEEQQAFMAWIEEADKFRVEAHRRLEELDEKIQSLRQCNRAFKAYGGLESHHRAQRLQQKL